MHRRRLLLVPVILVGMAAAWPLGAARVPDDTSASPTIDELISLKRAGSPAISPDGRLVALHRARDRTGTRTRTRPRSGSPSRDPATAPAHQRARSRARRRRGRPTAPARLRDRTATTSGRSTDRSARRGSAQADVGRRGRRQLRVVARRRSRSRSRRRDAKTGGRSRNARRSSAISRSSAQDHRMSHLWVLDVASARPCGGSPTARSPSGSSAGRPTARESRSITAINAANANGGTADISIVTVADGNVRPLVTQDGPDTNPVWSPDGSRIAFETRDGEAVLLLRQQRDRRRSPPRAAASRTSAPRSTKIRRLSWTARRHLLQCGRSTPGRFSSASTRRHARSRSSRRPSSGSDRASA